MGQTMSLALAIGLPLGAGMSIGLTLKDEVNGWYKRIRKPKWTPPNWLFGPAWTVLYTMIGVASWKVWRAGAGATTLGLYGAQLLMNLAWSPLFFKQHEIGLALADITALVGVISATIIKFNKVDPTAAYLMMPYLGWTTFAATLTLDIYRKNPHQRGVLKYEKLAREAKEVTLQSAEYTQAKAAEAKDAALPKVKEAYGATKDAVQTAADVTGAKAQEAYGAVKNAVGKGEEKTEKELDTMRKEVR